MKSGYKKFLQTCLVCSMVFGLVTNGVAAEDFNAVNVSPDTNFTDLGQAGWAQKNIIRLKIRGIASGYTDGTFRPNSPVTKAEAVIMAVRELGMETQALQLANNTNLALPEDFGEDIPRWAIGFVSVAWEQGLIKVQDNNFKWNAPADRAYIAQLAVRLMGKEQQASFISNPVSNFTDDANIPSWARGYVAVAVSEGILVGYNDGTFQPDRTVTRAELTTVLALYEDKMILSDVVHGTVEDVNADNLIVADKDDNLFRFYLANGASIFKGNTIVGFQQISEGGKITLIKVDPKTAGFIDFLSSGDDKNNSAAVTIEGGVVSVDIKDGEIRIKDEDGDRTTYSVDNDADIIIDGDDGNDLNDVKDGDKVELRIENGEVTRIEVTEGSTVEGEVIRISSDDDEIRIKDEDGERITYSVDNDADIIINGNDDCDLDDITVGDKVELRIKNGEVTRIEVTEGSTVEGEVIRVSNGGDEIRIEDEDGDRTTYSVDDDADIFIGGDKGYDLDDIAVGMEVELHIKNGNIDWIKVIGDKVVWGAVVSVDVSDEEIRIKDDEGSRTTYRVDDDADIVINNKSGNDLDDINTNDNVKLVTDDNLVVKIWVAD